MRFVTPLSKLVAELKPVNGWQPIHAWDYDGIEWEHPELGIVYATPDWNDKGKVSFSFSAYGEDIQHPFRTFRLPAQLNVVHRAAIYQQQAAMVLGQITRAIMGARLEEQMALV